MSRPTIGNPVAGVYPGALPPDPLRFSPGTAYVLRDGRTVCVHCGHNDTLYLAELSFNERGARTAYNLLPDPVTRAELATLRGLLGA